MAKKLMKGCEAIGEAAIQCGCRLFFGYPITPQNEIPEYLSGRLPQVGGTFVQAESEVAASNMLYGAAGMGTIVCWCWPHRPCRKPRTSRWRRSTWRTSTETP
jgi:2-oxoglutarate ferredoxin oxidoreductase subunit alpha